MGVNLNRYVGLGSHIPWHSDDESLFGPQNQSKLMVSLSSGHSAEFEVHRRASSDVRLPLRLPTIWLACWVDTLDRSSSSSSIVVQGTWDIYREDLEVVPLALILALSV